MGKHKNILNLLFKTLKMPNFRTKRRPGQVLAELFDQMGWVNRLFNKMPHIIT